MRYWQVQPGDTLSDIAVRFGADWKKLAASNKLTDPDRINPGDVILVPDDAGIATPESEAIPGPPQEAMPPYQSKKFVQPEPYKTSWMQDINPGESTHTKTVPSDPVEPAPKPPAELKGPGYSKPYPVLPNPDFKPGDPARPAPEALLTPEFWTEFLQKNLPTALMALGPRSGGHTPSNWRPPSTPPSDPARQAWLTKEKAQFERNPGMPMDPIYREVRDRALTLEKGRGPGGGRVTPEGQAADAKDWNFYRRQGKDSKAVPFPRKNEPVREQYAIDPETPNDLGTTAGAIVGMLVRRLIGSPVDDPLKFPGENSYNGELVAQGSRTRHAQVESRRLSDKAAEVGPGSAHPKGYSSDHSKNVSPFTSAIRGGMDRAAANPLQGTQVAGPGYTGTPMTPRQTYQQGQERFPTQRDGKPVIGLPPPMWQPEYGDPYKLPNREEKETNWSPSYPGPVQPIGDVIPFRRIPLSDGQKYDRAVVEQQVNKLLEKEEWTDADIEFVKRLLGE